MNYLSLYRKSALTGQFIVCSTLPAFVGTIAEGLSPLSMLVIILNQFLDKEAQTTGDGCGPATYPTSQLLQAKSFRPR